MHPSRGPVISHDVRKVHNVAAIRVLIVDRAVTGAALRAALDNQSDIVTVGAMPQEQLVNLDLPDLRPDVLVLELLSAFDLEALRSIHRMHIRLRTVLVLPQTDSVLLYQALEAGANGVIFCPLAGNTLGDAVRAVHAGGTFISAEASVALLNDYLGLRKGAKRTSPLRLLSQRERQVFDLVMEGKTSAQIAQQLAISPKSVDTYRGRLMSKFGVSTVPGLRHFAKENGLT